MIFFFKSARCQSRCKTSKILYPEIVKLLYFKFQTVNTIIRWKC